MCFNPLRIKNKSLDFVAGRDCDFYYVPCGRCYDCQQLKVSDYVFRCISERLTGYKHIYYLTLTFNDQYLPKVEILGKVYECFDKKLVQKFIKRLRKCLDKWYGIKLKYFITSEFGEKYKRPHHHALFFLSDFLEPYIFKKLVNLFWSDPESYKCKSFKSLSKHFEKNPSDFKSFGFIKEGKYGIYVTDDRPLEYVAKYVGKDISFSKIFPSDKEIKLREKFLSTLSPVRGVIEHLNVNWSVINNSKPFTLMSINFGVNIIDEFNFENLVEGKYYLVDDCGKTKSYLIPLYFLRKVLYIHGLNINGNSHFQLNALGYKVQKERLLRSCEDDLLRIRFISSILPENIPSDVLRCFSFNDIITIFSNLSDDELEYLVLYRNFYRNKLKIDFGDLSFEKSIDYFHDLHTKYKKAVYYYEDKLVLSQVLGLYELDELCWIVDRILHYDSFKKALDYVRNEKIFKTFYYGEQYIEESVAEVYTN